MANLFYSWQKLFSRVGLWKKDLVRKVGRDNSKNLATINFQNFGAFFDLEKKFNFV
jgi:hypothetical protein